MKNLRTELVFILDRSGSMSGLEDDTVGGYNAMLDKQRDSGSDVTVTTVLFDDRYELLHDRIKLGKLVPMSREEYFVRGCTALIDAIGRTILKIEKAQKHTAKSKRADNVIFVITTDGYENASRKFTAERVKKMVEKKRKAEGWEFIFLGANIDAVETGASYGMDSGYSGDFIADSYGMGVVAHSMGGLISALSRVEKGKKMPARSVEHFFSPISDDYNKRSKGNDSPGSDTW
jgi:uncharacterized protein YegL